MRLVIYRRSEDGKSLEVGTVLGTRQIFVDASPRHAVLPMCVTRHLGVCQPFFQASSLFRITRHLFSKASTKFYHESWRDCPALGTYMYAVVIGISEHEEVIGMPGDSVHISKSMYQITV